MLFCLKWRNGGPWDKKGDLRGTQTYKKKSPEGNRNWNGHSALGRCTHLNYATILCLWNLSVRHQHHHIHPLFLWFTHQTPHRRYLSHLLYISSSYCWNLFFFTLMVSILPTGGIYSSSWWNQFFLLTELHFHWSMPEQSLWPKFWHSYASVQSRGKVYSVPKCANIEF